MSDQHVLLYVEDDPLARKAMRLIIEQTSEDLLYVFDDSQNFLARLEALPAIPHLILLDIHLQPYTGFDLLAMLQDMPEYSATPVVALTASVMNEEIQKLKDAGFHSAIGKPFSIRTLPDYLRRIGQGERIWRITDV